MAEKISSMIATPTISDNLWKAMQERWSGFNDIRILEFGSGGSTLGFLNAYLDGGKKCGTMEIVSFEHWPKFYLHMCNVIPDYLESRDAGLDLRFSIWRLKGPLADLKEVSKKAKEYKKYEVPPVYNILGSVKNRWLDPVRWAVRAVDTLNRNACYILSKAASILRYYFVYLAGSKPNRWNAVPVKMNVSTKEFKDHINRKYRPGKYMIEMKTSCGLTIKYYLFPERSKHILWRRRDIDGTFKDFEDYVTFPIEGKFEMVYLDGRSRVSCVRRVLNDNLLSAVGYLFMHDAYKEWYKEGLPEVYKKARLLDGNNIRIDGNVFLDKKANAAPSGNKEELLIFTNANV